MKTEAEPIDIYICADAMTKLRSWTYHAKGEVSGLGLVEANFEDGRIESLEITDAFIVRQTCSASSTELDQEAVGQLLVELEREGKANQLKLWWHSHGDLGVFWSQTDDANVRRMRTDDYLVSIVINKRWDILARVDWFSPVRLTVDELPAHILINDHRVDAQSKQDVEELVEEVSYTIVKPKTAPRFRTCPPEVDEVLRDPFGFWDWGYHEIPFLEEEP